MHPRHALTLLLAIANGSGCYHLPIWKGEVKVTPRERESIKKCGNDDLTEAGKKLVTREPYLQGTTTTSTTIAWGSRSTKGRVVLTDAEDHKKIVSTSSAAYVGDPNRKQGREAAQQRAQLAADDIYVVAAPFAKLEPTHLYCYQVFDGDVALTELAPMATAAAPVAPPPIAAPPTPATAVEQSGGLLGKMKGLFRRG